MTSTLACIVLFAMQTSEVLAAIYSPSQILHDHNVYRCMHGVPSLSWSGNLVSAAQQWANHQRDQMVHGGLIGVGGGVSKGKRLGQNLYISWTTGNVNADQCTKSWYDEIRFTPGRRGAQRSFNHQTGHYTQVVWKGTQWVGCGRWCGKSQGMNCCQVVCDYFPAGNMMGAFAANVLPTSKSAAACARAVAMEMQAVNASIPEEIPTFWYDDSEEAPATWWQLYGFGFTSFFAGCTLAATMIAVAKRFAKRSPQRADMSSALLAA